jgi:2-oxoglutarate dehydrogenase E2 component (dihydrolipoamide succinyltransferase)
METVTMPQLGETVTEGTITRWLKQVGDDVAVDDVLFEVSTEKVDTEVPSAHAGIVRAIYVQEGETVPIGTLLAVLTDSPDEPLDGPPPALAAPTTAESPPTATAPASTTVATAPARPQRTAAVRTDGETNGYLSPVVSALLAEHGLTARDVKGSGRDGRITRADVLAAAANQRAVSAAPAAVVPAIAVPPAVVPGPDDEVVEFTKARRATAEHMIRSRQTSAHTLVVTEVDYFGVDPVRRRAGLSFIPFVARAVIDAIGEYPYVNASVGDDALIVHRTINLGIAVDVELRALVVPVLKDAGAKRLRALSDGVAELAERARAKRLTADDLSGGTFTITNVGAYRTLVTAPIINQPQVAILSTDGVKMRPVAVASPDGEWTVAVHPVGNLSLSFDHRAFDGAYASAFLARVREVLEGRDWSGEV